MKGYQFQIDLKELVDELRAMERDAPMMMARALNRAGTSGKTAMVKAVAKDTGITQKAIGRQIKVDKAKRTQPVVALTISGRPIPLIEFDGQARKKGATYRSPAGGRKTVPHGFITRVGKGGHRGIFVRSPTPSPRRKKKPNRSQLPIVEKKTPPLPHWFERRLDVFHEAARESLLKNLRHEITFAKRKATGSE